MANTTHELLRAALTYHKLGDYRKAKMICADVIGMPGCARRHAIILRAKINHASGIGDVIEDCTSAIDMPKCGPKCKMCNCPNAIRIAYETRGDAYYQRGDFLQAIKDCRSAIGMNGSCKWATFVTCGKAYYQTGQYDLAIETLSVPLSPKFARVVPPQEYVNILLSRAEAYLKIGENAKALQDCDMAVDAPGCEPGRNVKAFELRARVHLMLGYNDKAIRDSTLAIGMPGWSWRTLVTRAEAWLSIGESFKAVGDCARATGMPECGWEAYGISAKAKVKMGEFIDATKDCAHAIQMRGCEPWVWDLRGKAYSDLSERDLRFARTLREAEDCSICLQKMSSSNDVSQLCCGHVFHTKCIDQCKGDTCPLCRRPHKRARKA